MHHIWHRPNNTIIQLHLEILDMIPVLLIILLTLVSCEADIDFNRIDGEPCIFLDGMIGNAPASLISAQVATPMNMGKEDMSKAKVKLTGTISDESISFSKEEGGLFFHEIRPGDKIEIHASAAGVSDVHASTIVPEPINLISSRIISKEGTFITFEIIYEENAGEEGYYGIMFNDTSISEAPGILLSESYDMVVPFGQLEGTILIWDRHKTRREGDRSVFKTSIDTDSEKTTQYSIRLVSLSPEAYMYLRNIYIKTSTNFGAVGMGTPAITYSNVIGGIGVVGSWWVEDALLTE